MEFIALPPPHTTGDMPLEETLQRRRSVRSFRSDPLTLDEVSQVLWAAQGITGPENERTAPSAGATFPIEIYVFAGEVEGISQGVFKYHALGHRLDPVEPAAGKSGAFARADIRRELVSATGQQDFLGVAPMVIAVAAVRARTRKLYGERAVRYVDMEAGAALQNAALQCVGRGLGSVVVGAFEDEEVRKIFGVDGPERFLAMLAVGRPAG